LGVPEGPERSQLVKGQSVTLPDGRVVSPDDVLGEQMHGAKLVYIGDLARFDHVREHVQDADTLVIEATFSAEETESARAFGHITAREAAELARDCNVKSLLLTHISRRYRARDLVEEARAIFPNTVVARDLEHYTIKRGIGAERKIEETPVNESE
jgi:ribonuclease Z